MPRKTTTSPAVNLDPTGYWQTVLEKMGVIGPITLEIIAPQNAQPPAPNINPHDFMTFLRNLNRGAQKKGLPPEHPTTIKEFMQLPKEEKDRYIEAYKIYKEEAAL